MSGSDNKPGLLRIKFPLPAHIPQGGKNSTVSIDLIVNHRDTPPQRPQLLTDDLLTQTKTALFPTKKLYRTTSQIQEACSLF